MMRRAGTVILALLICQFAVGLARSEPRTLREQVSVLAERHGIKLKGGSKIIGGRAKQLTEEQSVRQKFEVLLNGYNYVVVGDGSDGIRLLHVLGRLSAEEIARNRAARPLPLSMQSRSRAKLASSRDTGDGTEKSASRRVVINTRRFGENHQVIASLTGPNGAPLNIPMTIDPSANTIMLPTSMIEIFGFDRDELEAGYAKTPLGGTSTESGLLLSVKVGEAEVGDVYISFVQDKYLPNDGVLGLSFLRRFRYTLDDEKDQLILVPR